MGGSSKSKTTENKTTTVNTTTSTQMGDVGLTGSQMVDMAAVLESGGIERERIAADTINNLVMATGNAWNQLVGGASSMVETAKIVSENIVDRTPILPSETTAIAASEKVNQVDLNAYIPIIGLGLMVLMIGMKAVRR